MRPRPALLAVSALAGLTVLGVVSAEHAFAAAAPAATTPPGVAAINAHYAALGGPASALRGPVGGTVPVAGGLVQTYVGGIIAWSPGTGAFAVQGAILDRYRSVGGPGGLLGWPVTDESTTPDTVGRYNHFSAGGSVYWSPGTGAHAVLGEIRAEWAATGWELGPMGYPATDETATPDRVGRYNHFSGGSVYWSPATGAHEVHGSIRAEWAATGWEAGPLGYPATDESVTPDTVGRYNHFSKSGSVYWTAGTGAHAVLGAIRGLWASTGWENGPLGYPTSDEYAYGAGRRNDFVHGAATRTPTAGASYGLGPAQVSALVARPGASSAVLEFTAVPGATGYQASADGVVWTTVTTTALPSGTVRAALAGLQDDVAVTVRLRAVLGDVPGPAATVVVVPHPAAAAPQLESVDAHDGWAQLRFQPPAGLDQASAYEWSRDGVTWQPLRVARVDASLSADVTGLANGAPTAFRLRGSINGAPGSASSTVAATPVAVTQLPGAVTAQDASLADGLLAIRVPTGQEVRGYQWSSDGSTWRDPDGTYLELQSGLTRLEARVPSFAAPGGLRVRALTTAGAGPAGSPLAVDLSLPVVSSVQATGRNGRATVTATLAASSSVAIPTLQWSLDGRTWTSAGPRATFDVPGLVNAVPVTLQVRTTDGWDTQDPPLQVTVTPRAPAVPATPAVTVTPYDGALLLTFPAVPAATGYEVALDGGAWAPAAPFAGQAGQTLVLAPLVNGRSYSVRLRAVSDGVPGTAAAASGTPQPGAPATPAQVSGLSTTAGDGTVTLSFGALSQDVTGYQVSTDGGTTWQALPLTGDSILSTTVTGLTNGTTYTFQVRALNGPVVGAASDPVTETPQATP